MGNTVLITVKGDDNTSAAFNSAGKAASNLGSKMGSVLKVGALGAAAGIGVAAYALKGFVEDAMASQKVMAQTNAVLASTKGVSGMTAKSVSDLATALSKVIPIDDELIQSTENMLLTFTNVGKDVFPAATEAALNMSIALGQDAVTSAMQLGKALNDPIAGVTALRRVGVQLTDQQKDQIEVMVKSGDIMGAQTIILKELTTEFGNSGRAAGETMAGKMAILNTQIGNVKEAIGAALIPTLVKLGEKLSVVISDHQADIDRFAAVLAEKIPDALDAIGAAIDRAMPTIKDIAKTMGEGFDLIIKPALKWIIDNQVAVVAAFAAIGVAALLAFTPVTGPVAAIVAGLGLLLYTTGKVREAWDDFSEANARAAAAGDTNRDSQTRQQHMLETIGNYLHDTLFGSIELTKVALYELGHVEFIALTFAIDEIGVRVGILRDFVVDKALPGIGAAWRGLKYEVDWIPGFFAGFVPVFQNVVDSIQWVIDRIYQLIEAIGRIPSPGDFLPDIPSPVSIFKKLFGRASGGPAEGLTLVGERGPELVNLPGGSHVFSNDQSRGMMGGNAAGGGGAVIYATFNLYGGATPQDETALFERFARFTRDKLSMETLSGPRLPIGAFSPRRA